MTVRGDRTMGISVTLLLCNGRPGGEKCENNHAVEPERWERVYASLLEDGWVSEGNGEHYCPDCADERAGVLTRGERPGVEAALAAVRALSTGPTPDGAAQGVALCIERLETMLATKRSGR